MTISFSVGEVPADNPLYDSGRVRLHLNGQFVDVEPATARTIAVHLILSAEKVSAPIKSSAKPKSGPNQWHNCLK